VRLIQEERLSWVGCRAGTCGFRSVLVNVDEVRPLTTGEALRGLTIQQTTVRLKTNYRVVKGLIRVSALQTVKQRHPVVRNMHTIIPHHELARFDEKYVSLFTLARERGKSLPSLLRELQELGARPVLELGGVGATFFTRSDVPS
jgi:hypothetical protein